MPKKIIRRYFIPYLLILVGFTILTAFLSILFFMGREQVNILEKQHKQLEMIRRNLDQECKTLHTTASWIAGNAQFTPGTLSRDPIKINDAINHLSTHNNINSFTDSIMIFYKDLPYVVTAESTHRLTSLNAVFGDTLPQDPDFGNLAYNTDAYLLSSRDEKYYYIRHTLPINSLRPYAVVLYRIPKEKFLKKLDNPFSHSYGGSIILEDKEGLPILGFNIGDTGSPRSFSETQHLENSPLSITSRFPKKTLAINILPLLGAQLLSFVILVITGSIIIYWFSVKNSLPLLSLKEAVEESLGRELPPVKDDLSGLHSGIDELNSLVSHSQEAMKDKITQNALCGMYDNREDLILAGNPYGIGLWFELTGIALISITDLGQFSQKSELIEFFERHSEKDLVFRGKNRARKEIVLLLITCSEEKRCRVIPKLNECCRKLRKEKKCHIYCTLGPMGSSPNKLPFSFSEANKVLGQGIFSEEKPVLKKEDLLKPTGDKEILSDFLKQSTHKLILAMLSGTEEEVRDSTDTVIDELKDCRGSLIQTRLLMDKILANTRSFLAGSGVKSSLTDESFLNQDFQSLGAFSLFLKELCLDGHREFGKMKSASGYELGRHLLRYVEENYNHPNLTIESMADHFSISRQYLNRLFKEQMGQPVSEYIKDLRYEKCCLLLCQTDMKVESIVREVGYSDTSSFIRNFRSREGMTPGQYRKKRTVAHPL